LAQAEDADDGMFLAERKFLATPMLSWSRTLEDLGSAGKLAEMVPFTMNPASLINTPWKLACCILELHSESH